MSWMRKTWLEPALRGTAGFTTDHRHYRPVALENPARFEVAYPRKRPKNPNLDINFLHGDYYYYNNYNQYNNYEYYFFLLAFRHVFPFSLFCFPRKLASTCSMLPSGFAAKRRDCRILVPHLREAWMADGFLGLGRFRPSELMRWRDGSMGPNLNSARFQPLPTLC